MTVAYKLVRPNLTDWHTGKIEYTVGSIIEQADCDGPEAGSCGRGLHVAVTARIGIRHALSWGGEAHRPWRYLEVVRDLVSAVSVLARSYSGNGAGLLDAALRRAAVLITQIESDRP